MKTTNVKEWVMPSLILVIICLVITAALAVTYQITKPIIEEINIKNANIARSEVLPDGAGSFTALETVLMDNVLEIYQADNGSGLVITTIDKGFGGKMVVMIGVNNQGEIQGVKITNHSETPGLGTKAMTSDHLSQYIGNTDITNTGEAGKANVDAVTGATVSSNAIFRAVETALEQYEQLGGVQ
ncbi:MAG: FMN-binding protein [Eubacteriales bacterium]|nr:FMN-binding protein [Eubacteriales bacterium]MDD4583527.1 FMN-binding protein [Eubacteriales bacterium]